MNYLIMKTESINNKFNFEQAYCSSTLHDELQLVAIPTEIKANEIINTAKEQNILMQFVYPSVTKELYKELRNKGMFLPKIDFNIFSKDPEHNTIWYDIVKPIYLKNKKTSDKFYGLNDLAGDFMGLSISDVEELNEELEELNLLLNIEDYIDGEK